MPTKFINVFLLIFSITIIIKPLLVDDKANLLTKLKPSFKWNHKNYKKSSEPIVLIILDELSSSKEIFEFTKDSIDFELEKELSKMNFHTRDPFISFSRFIDFFTEFFLEEIYLFSVKL